MYRLRLKFAKQDRLRFISHLELMRTLERAARRADFPLALSRGFSPKPRISTGPPLPVGASSKSEYADFILLKNPRVKKVVGLLNSSLPEDLRVVEAKYVLLSSPSLMSIIKVATYEVKVRTHLPLTDELIERRVADFFREEKIEIKRGDKRRMFDLREAMVDLAVEAVGAELLFRTVLRSSEKGSIRPEEIAGALFGLPPALSFEVLSVHRTGLYAESDGRLIDPMDVASVGREEI
ncbi:MAG: TIGR03936 family radical SAM-associated protein [Actinomycetota bacterium]|nr:TIGR03936 family radical SAM-associated protein [Actinomycetota bacterium]